MADIDVRRFLASPDFDLPVIVLYGSGDAVVDGAARQILAAYQAAANTPVDVDRATTAEITDDPARLIDFFSAASLFGDRRALVISGLTERLLKVLDPFLADAPRSEDLVLFFSSSLRKKSKTLDLFRKSAHAHVLSAYDGALPSGEIRRLLAGMTSAEIEQPALEQLAQLSNDLDGASFHHLLEKIALYSDGGSVAERDIAACAPPEVFLGDGELFTSILSGRLGPTLTTWRRFRMNDGDANACAAILGRQLTNALSAATSPRGARSGLFWKVERALTAATSRLGHLSGRLERAAQELHHFEKAQRSTGSTGDTDFERALLKITSMFR